MTDRLRDRTREATRERLLDAGQRLFAERGYDRTTAAEIAAAAGVTERTFFRHFATKTDLVMTNWGRLAATMQVAMAAEPQDTEPIEVVRAGVLAFADDLARRVEREPAVSMAVYAGHLPVLSMLEVVLALEFAIAVELGARLEISDELAEVRMAANASVGVLRAAGRAYALGDRGEPLGTTVSDALDRLRPLFDALTDAAARAIPQPARVRSTGAG